MDLLLFILYCGRLQFLVRNKMKRFLAWFILVGLPALILLAAVPFIGWKCLLISATTIVILFVLIIVLGKLVSWALDNIER